MSEYDQELKAARTAKRRDMDRLAAITKGLKDLRGLIGTGRTASSSPSKPEAKPVDPFLASVQKASKPAAIRAMSSPPISEKAADRAATSPQREAKNATGNTEAAPGRYAGSFSSLGKQT